jgi:hypothetical protein
VRAFKPQNWTGWLLPDRSGQWQSVATGRHAETAWRALREAVATRGGDGFAALTVGDAGSDVRFRVPVRYVAGRLPIRRPTLKVRF